MDTGGEKLKLHLGCGPVHIPGFVHIDKVQYDHLDHCHEVQCLPFLAGDSAELIYASHILEYFDRLEALDVLKEWHRILEPGGTLRLAVPNFEALVEVYRRTGSLALIVGPLYGRMGKPCRLMYHRTVYDFASLATLLRSTGFCAIRRWNWRTTEHADTDDGSQAYYPHLDKENGLLLSLNMEANARK